MSTEGNQKQPGETVCPLCGGLIEPGSEGLHSTAEEWDIKQIRLTYPDWIESDGACATCLELYRKL